jgi:uncharacterized protein (TIGR03435 family)
MQADDMDLMRQFARNNSDEAFAALVRRHVNLVYSVALRQLGNLHEAEEVTQAVFIILARKAASLRDGTILSGWLYQTARLTSANFQRTASRRLHREQEAFMQFTENSDPDISWQRLSPLLEEAMAQLGQKERDAVVLRFFENRTVREVASALGLEESAAQKRVNRATDKLRAFFARRSIQVSTVALLASIGTHAVQAAPAELTTKLAATAALKSAAVSGSTLTLIKTTLKIMAWTKMKIAIVVGAGVLLAAGTTTITVKEIQEHRTYPWQKEHASSDLLNKVPPQVRIIPTKFPRFGGWGYDNRDVNRRIIGIGTPVGDLLQAAYGTDSARMIFPEQMPQDRYDFIANLTTGSQQALQQQIKKQFGLTGILETRETDVLLLTVKFPHARGLKPTAGRGSNYDSVIGPGHCSGPNVSLTHLAELLENYFRLPVIDQTGVAASFDIDLTWDEQEYQKNPDGLKQALLDQLGLELVPSRAPVEMMVVDKQ